MWTLFNYIRHNENTPIKIHVHCILKISPPKTESFLIKILIFFHISAQNIDCGYSLEPPRRGGSNEYPQSMLLAEIRKIMYTPINPIFTILKWSLTGSKLNRYVFVMILPLQDGSSVAILLCLCFGGFICAVCFVNICSSFPLYLLP